MIEISYNFTFIYAQKLICQNKFCKQGNKITIYKECFRLVNRKITYAKDIAPKIFSYSDVVETELQTIELEDKNEELQKKCSKIINKMKLSTPLLNVLNCYMAGMSFVEIARFLNLNKATVWKNRQRLKLAYTKKILQANC